MRSSERGPGGRRRWRWTAAGLAVLALALGLAACGSDDDGASGDRPEIVVTTPVLGSLVRDLVGDQAQVEVIMPRGVDPHDYQPSAKDAARVGEADLVVENGLGLEARLHEAIESAEGDGAAVFAATDHVKVRHADESVVGPEEGEEGHEGEEEHGHGAEDPHVWLDPLAMRDMTRALAAEVKERLGLDVDERATALEGRLTDLDTQIKGEVAALPQARRVLVTGHDSMGYFADRYGFTVVGAVIPSLSSQAEVSAGTLARLKDKVRANRVPAIFGEIGTPAGVAEAVADETGARLVEVDTHNLLDDGSYFTFFRTLADKVVDGLASRPG